MYIPVTDYHIIEKDSALQCSEIEFYRRAEHIFDPSHRVVP